MMISVPFYENDSDGKQCMQVTMRSVIKHFFNRNISLAELDKLTGRKEGFWTWTHQIVPVLYDLGLKVKNYGASDLRPFLEGEPYIRRTYGKDAEKMLKFTDMTVMLSTLKKMLKYDLFEKRVLQFSELEDHIKQGHVPLLLIDNNKITGKDDLYQGHFVILTGFDEEYVYYHDSGPKHPEPNRKVLKSVFIDAWSANGADNDTVIVYGVR